MDKLISILKKLEWYHWAGIIIAIGILTGQIHLSISIGSQAY